MTRRLRFATARQVFEAFPAVSSDMEAKPDDAAPLIFLNALLNGPTPEDAVSFCAYLLPRREAVWWACQCIRAIERPLSESDEGLLALAETWVREPEEANRQAALISGQAAERKSPAAWAALGAAWSGGNMLDDPERPVPPPAHLTAKAVRAAVLTSLARLPTRPRSEHLAMSIESAVKLLGSDPG